jgi:clathrin heavy chain
MEHIKLYAKKLNAHVVVNACVQYRHWLALRVLHTACEDWLAAAQTMLEHPAEAWEHELFKETVSKMGNSDVCYTAIGFYLQHAPGKLHDFLTTVAKRIDSERVMTEVRRFAQLTFVRKFLESTQDRNVRRVNDALNSMYVEEEDFAALRRSVDSFNNFDSAELSARLEKLELFEFRKIALLLHRRNKRFGHAVEVAKANNLFQEAIDAAAESRDAELAEKLLRWFVVDKKRADCLAACLYVCYDLVPQHVVLELAWQYGMLDAAMPYLVQSSQELTERVSAIEKAMQDAQKHAKEAASHAATVAQHGGHAPLMITGGGAPGHMF